MDGREGKGTFDQVGADEFEEAIARLVELNTVGGKFTWQNGVGKVHTGSRLYTILGNDTWIEQWPHALPQLHHGTPSDHLVMFLELIQLEKGSKLFNFYNTWIKDETFNEFFRRAWNGQVTGTPLYKLVEEERYHSNEKNNDQIKRYCNCS